MGWTVSQYVKETAEWKKSVPDSRPRKHFRKPSMLDRLG